MPLKIIFRLMGPTFGSSMLESSCTLWFFTRSLLALIASMACTLFSPKTPTVGAGTRKSREEIVFLEIPKI
jgi:hypothetical protein